MLLKLLALQAQKHNLKQFRNSKIKCLLAPILRCSGGDWNVTSMRASFFTARPFELFFGVGSPSILVVQGRLFEKMSKESVIDCGDRLQGGIIFRKPS